MGQEQHGGPILYVDPDSKKVYVLDSESHIILLGSSGSGKTRRVIVAFILSLIRSKESFTIVDVKGDLRELTWCFAEMQGYRTITLNFRDLKNSTSFNPLWYPYLLYKSEKTDKASDLVRTFVHSILKYSKNADPFWVDSARSLIEACIFLLYEYGKPEEINILSVIKMIAAGVERFGPKKVFDIICDDCAGSIADFLLENVRTAPHDTLNSILSSAFQPLNIFVESPALIEMLTNNEFTIDSLDIEKPTAIYIVTPDENTNYASITATLVTQITTYFIQLAHEKYSGRLPYRMNICIEEAGNLGELPNLGQLMSAGRSRNLRLALVFQSLPSQLESIYGKSMAETIITNADTFIVFRTNQVGTQEEFSRKFGSRAVDYGSRTVEERLIKPEEIGAMETGRVLIMISGRIKYSTVLPDFTEIFTEEMKKWCPPREEEHYRTRGKIFDLRKKAEELEKNSSDIKEAAAFTALLRDNRAEEIIFRRDNKIKKDDLYYRVEIRMKNAKEIGSPDMFGSMPQLINKHRKKKVNDIIGATYPVFFKEHDEAVAFTKEILRIYPAVACIVCISNKDYDEDIPLFPL